MKRLAVFALLLVFAGCATSPTGRTQLTLMPDDQLNAMGLEAFNKLKEDKPVEEDPAVNRYVRCVATAIAAQAKDATGVEEWEVVVFQDKSANAFALPGGKIGVHTGLLSVATTQHQLAAVIGHEVGHVMARHSNERVSSALLAQVGLAAAAAAMGSASDTERGVLLGLLGVGTQVGVLMPYGRLHESEADRIGLDLMARAGFDPRESVRLWRNMSETGKEQPPEFLSTHPGHKRRIDDLTAHMAGALDLYERARADGFRPRCRPALPPAPPGD